VRTIQVVIGEITFVWKASPTLVGEVADAAAI
jgi:hypothetical protein